jgi:hypothetical protein
LGENDCAPFWLVTVIVKGFADGVGDGELGDDDPPPHDVATSSTSAATDVATSILRISAPVLPAACMRSKMDTAL